jgi:hypothetical protein
MFTMDVQADTPAPPRFHPEFGYLCPSEQLRRQARRVVTTVVGVMLIAAGTALAISAGSAPHAPREGAREPSAPSVMLSIMAALQLTDKAPDARDPDARDPDVRDDAAPAATAPLSPITHPRNDVSAPSLAQLSCDDIATSFLMSRCQLGKARKSHLRRAARIASHQVVSIPIGRIEQHMARPAQPAEAALVGLAAVATNEPGRPDKPAASDRRPIKTTHKQVPRDSARGETLAATPAPEFGLFGVLHEPAGSGDRPWANRAWATRW